MKLGCLKGRLGCFKEKLGSLRGNWELPPKHPSSPPSLMLELYIRFIAESLQYASDDIHKCDVVHFMQPAHVT